MWRAVMRWHKHELSDYILKHERNLAPIAGNYFNKINREFFSTLRSGKYYLYWQDGEVIGLGFAGNDGNAMMHMSKFLEGADFNFMYGRPHHALWDYTGQDSQYRYPPKKLSLKFRPLYLMMQTRPVSLNNNKFDFIMANQEKSAIGEKFIITALEQCFGFKPTTSIVRARLRERSAFEPHIILSHDGILKAQAHVQSASQNYSVIGGVCTLPIYRGQGLAKRVTSHLCDIIRAGGRTPILTVDTKNEAAIGVYKRLGFEIIDNVHSYQRRL